MSPPSERELELEALHRVAEQAARGADPGTVFRLVAEEVAQLFFAEAGVVWRFEGGDAVVIGVAGEIPATLGSRFPLDGEGGVARVVRTGQPCRVLYADLAQGDSTWRRVDELGCRHGLAAPVHVAGRLWGALLVVRTTEHEFDAASEDRLTRFAELTGMAIANADDRERLRRRVEEHQAFGRIAAMVARGTPLAKLLGAVAEEAARLLDLEIGAVGRFTADAAVVEAGWTALGYAFPGDGKLDRVPLDGESVLAEVHRTGAPARVCDYLEIDSALARQIVAAGVRSSVAAPISVGVGLWGALAATSPRAHAIPDEAEERLERFAELVAVAIANAQQREELEQHAATDPLTQLANHRVFHERLQVEIAQTQRTGRPVALALVDLDHFKSVNDRHGHQVGDRVLRETAKRLLSQIRPSDTLARVGGEEFAWILPDCSELDAWQAAERARASVSDPPFASAGTMTISVGVSDTTAASTADELYRLADEALYRAKLSGRNVSLRASRGIGGAGSPEEQGAQIERSRHAVTIRALARIVDARDASTHRHSERVADLAVRLATALGWNVADAALLRDAALLHDVGKIAVPARASSRETERRPGGEPGTFRLYPQLGAQIASTVLKPIQSEWIEGHQERWDGNGYPEGFAGSEIHEGAQILAVADSWDTAVNGRLGGLSAEHALKTFKSESGAAFAPTVVDALLRLFAVGVLGDSQGEHG